MNNMNAKNHAVWGFGPAVCGLCSRKYPAGRSTQTAALRPQRADRIVSTARTSIRVHTSMLHASEIAENSIVPVGEMQRKLVAACNKVWTGIQFSHLYETKQCNRQQWRRLYTCTEMEIITTLTQITLSHSVTRELWTIGAFPISALRPFCTVPFCTVAILNCYLLHLDFLQWLFCTVSTRPLYSSIKHYVKIYSTYTVIV